jgi:hypothetical protein
MSLAGEKLRRLTSPNAPQVYQEVEVVQPIAIKPVTPSTLIVESVAMLTEWQIIEYVKGKMRGDWMLGIWTSADKSQKSNPYQDWRGLWVWLVVK